MAELVLGIGSSHSPMCGMPGEDWPAWGQLFDTGNPMLYTRAGQRLTYEQAVEVAGDTMLDRIDPATCAAGGERVAAAIDRLIDEIATARLDAVIVVGDDQDEHLLSTNLPPFLIYWGETMTNTAVDARDLEERPLLGFRTAYQEVDGDRDHPVAVDLARHLIAEAFAGDFDVATSDGLPIDGKAMGHAFGFAMRRLGCAGIPIVPVMINTYNPPAVPRAARCAAFGSLLRRAVDTYPDDLRVGVIASGGLSHFLVLEDLDREVLAAFERGDLGAVASIDEATLVAGTSEIKNWLTVAAMCAPGRFELVDYVPGYRTPAGTGTGLAFAVWHPAGSPD